MQHLMSLFSKIGNKNKLVIFGIFILSNTVLLCKSTPATYNIQDYTKINDEADGMSFCFRIENHEAFPLYFKRIDFRADVVNHKADCSAPDLIAHVSISKEDVQIDGGSTYSEKNAGSMLSSGGGFTYGMSLYGYFCNVSPPIYIDVKRGCKSGYKEFNGKCYPPCSNGLYPGDTFEEKRRQGIIIYITTWQMQEDCTKKVTGNRMESLPSNSHDPR